MAKKERLFGKVNNLIGTTVDKTESVLYESLSTTEMVFKSLTNTMEEFHNETVSDVIDSRISTATKLQEAKEKLKELGYDDDILSGMLQINRRQ
jgi:hypothetical protein